MVAVEPFCMVWPFTFSHMAGSADRALRPGDEPWADLAEIVAAFALGPLARAFGLKGALGHVIGHAIACDMGHRLSLGNVLAGFADDTASSTSQSVFSDPRGIRIGSSGPQMAEVAFMKMIGSGGTFRPLSAAWSA
jgi:hypothetical protein